MGIPWRKQASDSSSCHGHHHVDGGLPALHTAGYGQSRRPQGEEWPERLVTDPVKGRGDGVESNTDLETWQTQYQGGSRITEAEKARATGECRVSILILCLQGLLIHRGQIAHASLFLCIFQINSIFH